MHLTGIKTATNTEHTNHGMTEYFGGPIRDYLLDKRHRISIQIYYNRHSINDYKCENNLTISLIDDTVNTFTMMTGTTNAASRRCTPIFLTGVITSMGVFILVDTGAMHNIVDINVACAISLREQRIDTTILISSGTNVTCQTASFSTLLCIDNEVSTIDVFLLDIGNNINVVLGTPWLASLRRLMWDFTSMEL
jgi:hypothetical protein